MTSTPFAKPVFPAPTARLFGTVLLAGALADVTWEVWARAITPLLVGGPLEPAALVQSVFGLARRNPSAAAGKDPRRPHHKGDKPMTSRKTYHQFDTAAEALEYRKTEGCGGWIFVSKATGEATIFPVGMTPRDVMWHPLAEGSGKLIGAKDEPVRCCGLAGRRGITRLHGATGGGRRGDRPANACAWPLASRGAKPPKTC